MNKHENLFYSYKNSHIEDNVTRAFVITLKNLSPVYLRIFIVELLLKKDRIELAKRIDLTKEADIEFMLQETIKIDKDDDEGYLNKDTGLILGISRDPGKPITEESGCTEDGGRLDAQMIDNSNEITLILESKLYSAPGKGQISKYYNTLFDDNQSLTDVYLNCTWNEIAEVLEKISNLCRDGSVERYFIEEFMTYLSYLSLIEFRGFSFEDFEELNDNELMRFLKYSLEDRKDIFWENNDVKKKFDFLDTNKNTNVYTTITNDGIVAMIVCGAGGKDCAKNLLCMVDEQRREFKELIKHLHNQVKNVNKDYELYLKILSRIFYNKVQRELLRIKTISEPVEKKLLDEFIEIFTDKEKNTFNWLKKERLNELFSNEINMSGLELDKDGLFPKWDNADKLLQYYYFDVQILIPKERFINRERVEISEEFNNLLDILKDVIKRIEDMIENPKR